MVTWININKLLQCGHSNHERYGFIFTLFVLFFHLFCCYFLYFSRTNQSHLWIEAMAQTCFPLSSVFLSVHATCLRCFLVRGYTCIPNNVSRFFGRNKFGFTEVRLAFSVHHMISQEHSINLLFQPSYSPHLNTCEFCFNQVKCYLKQNTSLTLNETEIAIGEAVSKIDASNSVAYFSNYCG